MKYDGTGSIKIRTYIASDAMPLEGVVVKIYGTDDYNKDVLYSLITDSNGLTKEIPLPAPPKSLSTSPGAPQSPYSVYTVELAKEGFYPKIISNVPIFSDTTALLPIEMIPFIYATNGDLIPQKNLNSTIYENEHLE